MPFDSRILSTLVLVWSHLEFLVSDSNQGRDLITISKVSRRTHKVI
jgi:hypothetical protein